MIWKIIIAAMSWIILAIHYSKERQLRSGLTGGETVDVVVNNSILSVRTMDVPELAAGDVVSIDGQDYSLFYLISLASRRQIALCACDLHSNFESN